MPTEDLLDTPRQVGRLMRAPSKDFSRLVDVHATPPLYDKKGGGKGG